LKTHVAVEGVIGDVGDEGKGGEEKSREHGRPVLADAPYADEAEADDEAMAERALRKALSAGRKIRWGAPNIGRRMVIDKPAEE
jgi:hypothetical protein